MSRDPHTIGSSLYILTVQVEPVTYINQYKRTDRHSLDIAILWETTSISWKHGYNSAVVNLQFFYKDKKV